MMPLQHISYRKLLPGQGLWFGQLRVGDLRASWVHYDSDLSCPLPRIFQNGGEAFGGFCSRTASVSGLPEICVPFVRASLRSLRKASQTQFWVTSKLLPGNVLIEGCVLPIRTFRA